MVQPCGGFTEVRGQKERQKKKLFYSMKWFLASEGGGDWFQLVFKLILTSVIKSGDWKQENVN